MKQRVLYTHQLFELSLAVAELLVHAEPHLRALQGGYDLQLSVFVLNDIVLQHQTQDLDTQEEPNKTVTAELLMRVFTFTQSSLFMNHLSK